MSEFVVCRKEGPVGHITLNRPKALNAVTHDMILALTHALDSWRDDDDIKLALVDSVLAPRAFCAGGDIRMLWDSGRKDGREAWQFFADEYRLNAAIAAFPKPYVALLDGITMGGGIGISVHGSHRIVSEHSVLAMPECLIGFFPDIGSSFFLNKCPGEVGMYLALTGARIHAADALHAGLATHFVASARMAELRARLLAGEAVAPAIDAVASDPGPAPLAHHRAALDRAFGRDSVEAIFAALKNEGEWGRETLDRLEACSPFSLKLIFAELRRAKGQSLPECLRMEFRIAARAVLMPEFLEGVRALIVDKDRAPKWNPPRLEDVPGAGIAALFQPLKNSSLNVPELTLSSA